MTPLSAAPSKVGTAPKPGPTPIAVTTSLPAKLDSSKMTEALEQVETTKTEQETNIEGFGFDDEFRRRTARPRLHQEFERQFMTMDVNHRQHSSLTSSGLEVYMDMARTMSIGCSGKHRMTEEMRCC
ncbi:hypothetical protein RvY_16847 [Ramazzottius varieornatus]|uniref:Uncharacterized protein n=1 Tax=Ramazzottius varieornatus TaxID=947166 RepID=A0A1D1W787_RAMVA|nr:hypothetical protein RvY_16847 [Ramazzottius varieornatus]